MEAKYMAMTEAMKEAIWLQRLLDYLGIDQNLLKINCDSMSAIYLVKNQVYLQGQSTSTSGSTLFERFLRRVTSSYKRSIRWRISPICLPRLFREWVTPNPFSCLSSVSSFGWTTDSLIPWARVHRQPHWCSPLESTWYYVEFSSDLRNFHRGGELWERKKNKKLKNGVF